VKSLFRLREGKILILYEVYKINIMNKYQDITFMIIYHFISSILKKLIDHIIFTWKRNSKTHSLNMLKKTGNKRELHTQSAAESEAISVSRSSRP